VSGSGNVIMEMFEIPQKINSLIISIKILPFKDPVFVVLVSVSSDLHSLAL
jgi:hypothetical protein